MFLVIRRLKRPSKKYLLWEGIDCIVHAVDLRSSGDDFADVSTREGLKVGWSSSIALAGRQKLMSDRNGSLTTLSYLGSQRTLPNY